MIENSTPGSLNIFFHFILSFNHWNILCKIQISTLHKNYIYFFACDFNLCKMVLKKRLFFSTKCLKQLSTYLGFYVQTEKNKNKSKNTKKNSF